MLELKNKNLRAVFHKNGARVISLIIDGVDVVFGNPPDMDIATAEPSAGAVVGRFAGRITKAQYELDGQLVKLVPNRGDFQLHGGPHNFGNQDWASSVEGNAIVFKFYSPDGDQGFPGEVHAQAVYTLETDRLKLSISATTTKPTAINLTNHAYWNMVGNAAGQDSIFGQELQINAAHYLPLSDVLLPSGEIRKVADSRFDFRALRKINEAYDNCYCLNGMRGEMKHGLVLRDPVSGRKLDVWTTEAAIQMYTAIHWDGTVRSNHGRMLNHQALAIEPQNYPDAPNHKNFPSCILRPGEIYRNEMEWRFS